MPPAASVRTSTVDRSRLTVPPMSTHPPAMRSDDKTDVSAFASLDPRLTLLADDLAWWTTTLRNVLHEQRQPVSTLASRPAGPSGARHAWPSRGGARGAVRGYSLPTGR